MIEMKTPEIKTKVCKMARVFEQNCGWDGSKTCIKGSNKILEYPCHCVCDIYDVAISRRICTCKFPNTPC
ncbi:LOW QUALITY PROTEIN: defensin-like protein 229 [Raphanus sativus]|uniref:LOW QUALITY PROTEIN: defensin-like protein 229 n=1 Tax=Raphanus sativus TaxID=3726 RepID=A0A6J0JKD3_RAPSA|nr:LOW QUALITY PROTEIN: defensin-like protein 229 [Raphanus sativus]